ncbi:MAG: aminotransferase class IV [Pseudomonadota bacterium]
MHIIDANAGEMITADDRGLLYGDGVFETMRVNSGKLPLLDWHLARLHRSTTALKITGLDMASVAEKVFAFIARYPNADWLKVILTRGSGARGYRPPEDALPTMILSSGPLVERTGECHLLLSPIAAATMPGVPPLKHLSRLVEVQQAADLAAEEDSVQIVCDQHGALVCATMHNLFVVREGELMTPRLVNQGVAGVLRDWVFAHSTAKPQRLHLEDALLADEIFVCNAVRGVVSANSICGQWLPSSTPFADALRADLVQAGFEQ